MSLLFLISDFFLCDDKDLLYVGQKPRRTEKAREWLKFDMEPTRQMGHIPREKKQNYMETNLMISFVPLSKVRIHIYWKIGEMVR